MTSLALRHQARRLYKELFYLGRDYPDPSYQFSKRVHGCFLATGKRVQTDEELQQAIDKADFIKKEVEALIFLRKYRHMKQRYDPQNE